MQIGMSTAKAAPIDAFMGVVRMFDDLRDPARRAEIIGQFEAEHAKLEAARAKHAQTVADAIAKMDAKLAEARSDIERAKAEAARARDEGRNEARALLEKAEAEAASRMANVERERELVATDRRGVTAAQAAADRQMAQARDLADQAATDRAAAEKALAEATKIQAENDRRARAAAQLAAEMR